MKYRTKAVEFVRRFFDFYVWKTIFLKWCWSTNSMKISSRFTDKVPFFAGLSVSKTHFTDKQAFSGGLSVNFCPLWWGFTDKTGFLEHLSVKPGPKRLKSYGQKTVCAHFVRNRHFSSRPITDKAPIFIDVSVNDKAFEKCKAALHLINQIVKPGLWIRQVLLKEKSSCFWFFPVSWSRTSSRERKKRFLIKK